VLIKAEILISRKVSYIFWVASDKVVHADNLVVVGEKTVAEVRAEKTSCSCDENTHRFILFV
jgi:hypothetical protein